MLVIKVFVIFATIYCAIAKTNVKISTKQGIEVGLINEELPPGLEEEPSAEVDDEDDIPSTFSIPPATRRETKKTTMIDTSRKSKDVDVIDEEEAKIIKELSAVYKDGDFKAYKDDEDEIQTKGTVTVTSPSKPTTIGKTNGTTHQDVKVLKPLERSRSSVHVFKVITPVTSKLLLKQNEEPKPAPGTALKFTPNLILCLSVLFI